MNERGKFERKTRKENLMFADMYLTSATEGYNPSPAELLAQFSELYASFNLTNLTILEIHPIIGVWKGNRENSLRVLISAAASLTDDLTWFASEVCDAWKQEAVLITSSAPINDDSEPTSRINYLNEPRGRECYTVEGTRYYSFEPVSASPDMYMTFVSKD